MKTFRDKLTDILQYEYGFGDEFNLPVADEICDLIEKEVIGEDKNLYDKERQRGISDWRVERENGEEELRFKQRQIVRGEEEK